jgi:hypothetical protein
MSLILEKKAHENSYKRETCFQIIKKLTDQCDRNGFRFNSGFFLKPTKNRNPERNSYRIFMDTGNIPVEKLFLVEEQISQIGLKFTRLQEQAPSYIEIL